MNVLNVAEKPTVAKEIAHALSGGSSSKRFGASKFNPVWEFDYQIQGQRCHMIVTSVTGHVKGQDFPEPYNKNWHACQPTDLFEMRVVDYIPEDKKDLVRNLQNEAKRAQWLVLWLDCDREGENIAYEVISICSQAKKNLDIWRAKFSDVNPQTLRHAVQNLQRPNKYDSLAVDARKELDLRLGAIFTRFQTLRFANKFSELSDELISYGPCQFPTLGFVVDRFWQAKCHVPEDFYEIRCRISKGELYADLSWDRVRLFDRASCVILYEKCVNNPTATITDIIAKETRKNTPFPLTTIDLQKGASKYLRISAAETMQIAETLYQHGYISYPRTETSRFGDNTDFRTLVGHQRNHPVWGEYASDLLERGKFRTPKKGRGDDKSHPPIHPTRSGSDIQDANQRKIYEFVSRHFLACCSEAAKGHQTTAHVDIAGEKFHCTGLMIIERNFLDIYPYWPWNDKTIPTFQKNEQIQPSSLIMHQGQTTAPPLLTEEELVNLMDKNGIGTDATIAEHINKIQERRYVVKEGRELKPTTLGEALVAGYNAVGLRLLSQPGLRAKTEADMKSISEKTKTHEQVVKETIDAYRKIFSDVCAAAPKLDKALARFFSPKGQNFDNEERDFSRCSCGDTMHLRQENRKSFLFCEACNVSHNLPVYKNISAHDHTCPLCNFQVVHITSSKDFLYTVCPYCFNNPPTQPSGVPPIESSNMPCFKCTNSSCPLSAGTSNLSIMKCPQCKSSMCLKKTKDKKYVLGCESYPDCSKTLWLPREITNASPTNDMCNNCTPVGTKRLVEVTFDKKAVPPNHPTKSIVCFGGCDEFINTYLSDCNRNFSQFYQSSNSSSSRTVQPQRLAQSFNNLQQNISSSSTNTNSRPPIRSQDDNDSYSKSTSRNNWSGNNNSTSSSWSSQGDDDLGTVNCSNCNAEVKLLRVKKDNANKGKVFASCKGCNHFEWADGQNNNSNSNNNDSSSWSYSNQKNNYQSGGSKKRKFPGNSEEPKGKKRKGGGGGQRLCSKCSQPGHDRRNCPEND
eukprot:TRINITY_DN7166_c1_g1_i2.p1 TRINITY_DN7166_c1_g1~~TRINITY_DN7166_c1_g1_i2.p1  ORF type:complete len:1024 (+),score=145.16 TRINITY_DN7166_c1_g1_i2:47-3118(+)